MTIIEPKTILQKEDNNVKYILRIQRNRNKMFLEHIDAPITDELIEAAIEEFYQWTEVRIKKKTMEFVLKLRPELKAEILEFTVRDSGARDVLMSTIANVFLGSRWPMYGDKVNVEQFVDALKEEIEKTEEQLGLE